jgi:ABC-2 type transporter
VIVYAMIGFEWTAAKFFWYLFFSYFTMLYFTYYGMMSVGLTPNYDVAAIVSSAFYGIWNLFSGFLITKPVHTCQNLLLHVYFNNFSYNQCSCLSMSNTNLA